MASPAQDLGPVLDKDGVRLTVDEAIATVTLTNPAKRNAQSPALWRALTDAGRALPGSVRVVVLRAEGKSFSAGLDRQAFTPEGFDGEPSFIEMASGSSSDFRRYRIESAFAYRTFTHASRARRPEAHLPDDIVARCEESAENR